MIKPLALLQSATNKLHLNNVKKRLLQIIIRELYKQQSNYLNIKNNKIFIDYHLLLHLSKIKEFKNYSIEAHELTKILKTKKYISSKSLLYPKNIKIFSINPIHKSFLYGNLQQYNKVLSLRDSIVQKLKDNTYTDIDLYIYARLFNTYAIKTEYITKISSTTFFKLNDSISICVCKSHKKNTYTHIEIFFIAFIYGALPYISKRNII